VAQAVASFFRRSTAVSHDYGWLGSCAAGAGTAVVVGCTDWFGGLGNCALRAKMKAEVFPAPEMFLSKIFLSIL
jgi:hypothetical protein